MRAWRVATPLVVLLLALLVVGHRSAPAYAGCAFGPGSPEAVEFADVIFTGEIISESPRHAVFAVDRVYKGQAHAEQAVLGGPTDTGSHALPVSGPGRFLILGRLMDRGAEPGVLEAGPCSGSRAGNAPASLGRGYPPVPGSTVVPEEPSRPSPAAWWGRGLLLTAVVVGVVLAARRFHRASAR